MLGTSADGSWIIEGCGGQSGSVGFGEDKSLEHSHFEI